MERTLTRYIRALRSAGAGVSTTEAMDAARTVEVVGWEDRSVLKTALGTVLAKSVEEKAIHEQLFELYFSREAAAASASEGQPGEGGDPDSGQPGEGEAGADPQSGDAEGDEGGDPVEALSARQREIMSLAAAGRDANAIAAELHLAPGSVRQELSKAYAVLVPEPTPGTDLRTSAVLAYLRATHPHRTGA